MLTVWTKRAETDLFLNIGKIAENSPQNAKKVLVELYKLVEDFKNFPLKFPKEPIYNKENIRVAIKWSFKIVYRVEKEKIYILRVFHSKQHPKKI